MGGQVWGGGVVVLVAVVLWLAYLLPSWQGRYRYNASERNAVRLNQALRVLAETSETPAEVRLELNARTALAQQRLARRVRAERAQAELEAARAELATAKAQARADTEIARERARADAEIARERVRAESAAAQERVRAESAAAQERARLEAAAAKAAPAARRARARRRARLLTTVVGLVALGLAVWGAVEIVVTGAQALLWTAVAIAAGSGLLLQRMSAVQRRVLVREAPQVLARPAVALQDVALGAERVGWTPRELPKPLTASAGSRAAAVLDGAAAREALRQAALEESMRERAERAAPPSIDTARRARAAEPDFARMGYVDDAEIEAHVRRLLERRAVGE